METGISKYLQSWRHKNESFAWISKRYTKKFTNSE